LADSDSEKSDPRADRSGELSGHGKRADHVQDSWTQRRSFGRGRGLPNIIPYAKTEPGDAEGPRKC